MARRVLQAAVQVNATALKQLPQQAAAAAAGVQQRLAAIQSGTAGGGVLTQRLAAGAAAQAAALQAAAMAAVATRVGPRGGMVAPPSPFGRGAGTRPTAVGGTSGSIGAGVFRGLAQEFGSMTGIGIPFLSLSPTFIAASAAASTLVVGLTAAFGAANKLAQAVTNLRQAAGGSLLEVSRLASVGRQFAVDTQDLATGLDQMRNRLESGNPAIQRLGISLVDANGQAKTGTQVFNEIRQAISEIRDPTLQASVANDIFGSSYTKLLPLLRQSDRAIDNNSKGIDDHAKFINHAVREQEEFQRRIKSGENAWTQFWEGFGQKTTAALGFWAERFEEVQKNQEQDAASQVAVREAQIAGLGEAEALAAGKAARARVAAEQSARSAVPPADVSAAPVLAIERLGQLASAAREARMESEQLNQALLNIGQQRMQIAFQIGMAERQIANQIYDQNQALANQAEDRAMHLAEVVAALTISLNEFNKAEFTAAVRAREEEKSFFAFRPDAALRRANEARRYDRDRAQQIERNERINAMAADQLNNQRQVAEFELAQMERQEKQIADQLALFNLTHGDVVMEHETAQNQLTAALIRQREAGSEQHVKISVAVDSADFSSEENARIREIVLRVVGEVGGQAIGLIRTRSGRPINLVGIGGPQE